jgi:hypothetical protein
MYATLSVPEEAIGPVLIKASGRTMKGLEESVAATVSVVAVLSPL